MNSAFDTLNALRSLESSGLDSSHAEAIVQVVAQSHEHLATKSGIARLQEESSAFQAETKAGFAAIRNEMRDGFAALRQELKQEMSSGFAASKKEQKEGITALRQELKQEMSSVLAASKKEHDDNLAVWKREIENSFALQSQRFQTSLSQTVNRMLVAQVAVGGLVVAVLRIL